MTLRHQSEVSPNASGIANPSAVRRAATGVAYVSPDRRPRCRTTDQKGSRRLPAMRAAGRFTSLVREPRDANAEARRRLPGGGPITVSAMAVLPLNRLPGYSII